MPITARVIVTCPYCKKTTPIAIDASQAPMRAAGRGQCFECESIYYVDLDVRRVRASASQKKRIAEDRAARGKK